MADLFYHLPCKTHLCSCKISIWKYFIFSIYWFYDYYYFELFLSSFIWAERRKNIIRYNIQRKSRWKKEQRKIYLRDMIKDFKEIGIRTCKSKMQDEKEWALIAQEKKRAILNVVKISGQQQYLKWWRSVFKYPLKV